MAAESGSDWVHFAVRYQDGRIRRIRVERFVLRSFDHSILAIVRDRQERGELPPGLIVSIESAEAREG